MKGPERKADATQIDRVPFVDRRFTDTVKTLEPTSPSDPDDAICEGSLLSCHEARGLFRSQLDSRHLDFRARQMKREGKCFYTIGSAGHEGNAAVAAALRPTDPAFLHYRSCAFFLHRARQLGRDATMDVMLGLVASSEEPIAGGRHKVYGSRSMAIPPQTSTIASHLPKAMGMAFALARAKRLGLSTEVPQDAVIACSFGDASANHSTAVGAMHASCWAAFQGQAVPVLFICEDNGLGISVGTPLGWIEAAYGARPGLRYFKGDGLDLAAAYASACEAVDYVRRERRPAFLHLRVVRLLGHAGSDLEATYKPLAVIEQAEVRDPLIASARLLVETGAASPTEILAMYEESRERIARFSVRAAGAPRIESAEQVMEPLAPRDDDDIAEELAMQPQPLARQKFWGKRLPEDERPMPMGQLLNRALGDLLVKYPELLIFGEDVGHKGGVYGITRGLAARARPGRVFDTLLDEQSILGLAIGAGQLGCLPVCEIQYLAYLHNAEDQLRGEAASLQFFSQGQFRNPMVVRIPSYAYQKGFGGHFHNDNSLAVLRDVPGIVIASPSRGDDAAAMLRTCVAAAKRCGSVCVFLEPIALYSVRDLHVDGDAGWVFPHDASEVVPIGSPRLYGDGTDLLIVSWANGLRMSLRVAERLKSDVDSRVLDLRWLAPLPVEDLLQQARAVKRVLIVDETRKSGGVSEALITALVEGGIDKPIKRIAAMDTFIPLGDAANLVLVQEADIERAMRDADRD